MPRSRGSSDVPQRLSPRATLHMKTTACSEANGVHRPVVERSPKFEDRRSPRSPLPEVVKKKGGTRVAELETKLGKAQDELKKLRDQLVSAETAKIDAEQALERAKKQIPKSNAVVVVAKEVAYEKDALSKDSQEASEIEQLEETVAKDSLDSPIETDVFEFVVPKDQSKNNENECESKQTKVDDAVDDVAVKNSSVESETVEQVTEDNADEMIKQEEVVAESSEMVELKSKLLEKEKEIEILLEEQLIFKTKAKEQSDRIASAARAKEEELVAKLRLTEEQLKESRIKTEQLGDQLKATEMAKSTIEADMKRLRIQTDQWRKAAEAAAAVIATGDSPIPTEMGGRRVAERCGSMDKHLSSGGVGGGYVGWGSPLMAGDSEDDGGVGSEGRRKGGIRMFGDLWKKKGQQK